jgi:hypothetical protein
LFLKFLKGLAMQELNMLEILSVSGAGGPAAGTLSRPTRGESEYGKMVNDAAGALNSFGSWLGIAIYDMLHS